MNRLLLSILATPVLAIFLSACSGPTEEAVRKDYEAMPNDKLMAEIDKQSSLCRDKGDPDDKRPGAPCNRSETGMAVAEAKGWCWGPKAATSSDKSWMRCEDDLTGSLQAQGPWFAATSTGSCKEVGLTEAISKVVGEDGPRNVRTSFTDQRFFDIESDNKEGMTRQLRLYPTCVQALMLHLRAVDSLKAPGISVPVGLSARTAGDVFGFDVRNCGIPRFMSVMTCAGGYDPAHMPPPIELSDGFTPCVPGRSMYFDFLLRSGMFRVSCSVTEPVQQEFVERMNAAFGQGEKIKGGGTQWKVRGFTVTAHVSQLYDIVTRGVVVAQD